MIKNIRGIEGDDIPYHLSLLGYDAGTMITDRYYFFPLNDHYNTHGPTWLEETTAKAWTKDVIVFYDLVKDGVEIYHEYLFDVCGHVEKLRDGDKGISLCRKLVYD